MEVTMRSNTKYLVLLIILSIIVVVYPQKQRQVAETVNVNDFPEFDFAHPRLSSPSDEGKRETKSKKYNNKNSLPISESSDQIYVINEWDVNLPALPVDQSAAVIIGQVIDAQAFLSEDRTNIYSEFTIRTDAVFKNDPAAPIKAGESISAERLGGRALLFSGKVVVSQVNHQDLPRIGRNYVFFLNHLLPTNGQMDDGLFILTAYQINGDTIIPLDKPVPGHPILKYRRAAKADFMNDLQAMLLT